MISRALKHLRLDRISESATIVWIDVQGQSMNVFNDEVLGELEFVVSGLESEASGVVMFRSSKASGFFAGADVHSIAQLSDVDEIVRIVCRGQKLFQRVQSLALRTVAAIHGPCLGGGLEFALACDERIALDSRATRLGLPETQLGIIPGWGGTQRLPRLIGVANALPLILKASKLTASAAWKVGLVDAVAEEAEWESLISRVLSDGVMSSDRRRTTWKNDLLRSATDSAVGRWLVLRTAERQIRRQARNYPALPAALRAIAASFLPNGNGYVVERNEFTQLVNSSTCRNLLNLFLWRERARSSSDPEKPSDDSSANRVRNRLSAEVSVSSSDSVGSFPRVSRIGVIGAGAMGSGIAQLAASRGLSVIIKELTLELAVAGKERIADSLAGLVRTRRMTSGDREELLSRVHVTDSYDDLTDCDLIIEAVVEKLAVKRAVFASLDAILPPDVIIASNTSALSVTDMAAATNHPGRVGGLHFFNPVHRMDLVEVIRAEKTDERTVARLTEFARRLGKTPVSVTDTPGFLVNRVLFPGMGEAIRMVMEGTDIRLIDREARKFGLPMGPLQLIDHVGLDVAWHVASTLEDVLPESSHVIRFLGEMVARGWHGVKTETGFYHYSEGIRGEVNDLSAMLRSTPESIAGLQTQVGRYLDDGLTKIQRRLIYPMINESGYCMQDGVVAEAWLADLAMILGTGFAPHTGGPLSLASSIGNDTLLNNLHVLTVQHGDRFKPSAWLVNQSEAARVPAEGDPASP